MIQIDDWMAIAGILAIFLLFVIYLAYIIVKSKLFPEKLEFQKEINPNEAVAISTIEGSGIIKKIEMKTTEKNESLITLIVDQTSFITFILNKKTSNQGGNLNALEETLNIEMNLNKKFKNNFTIFFHNKTDKVSHSTGNIYYEIKKPLKTTLKTLLSELH